MQRIKNRFSSLKKQVQQNIIAISSLLVALLGLSANVSYMQEKEFNSNLRVASFQLLIELSELEKVTFQLQYDEETAAINARTGWVKVRLIEGLSKLTSKNIQQDADKLMLSWQNNWQELGQDPPQAFDKISDEVANIRTSLIALIVTLK